MSSLKDFIIIWQKCIMVLDQGNDLPMCVNVLDFFEQKYVVREFKFSL